MQRSANYDTDRVNYPQEEGFSETLLSWVEGDGDQVTNMFCGANNFIVWDDIDDTGTIMTSEFNLKLFLPLDSPLGSTLESNYYTAGDSYCSDGQVLPYWTGCTNCNNFEDFPTRFNIIREYIFLKN